MSLHKGSISAKFAPELAPELTKDSARMQISDPSAPKHEPIRSFVLAPDPLRLSTVAISAPFNWSPLVGGACALGQAEPTS